MVGFKKNLQHKTTTALFRNIYAHLCINVVDEFINVQIVFHGTLVLEVRSHCQHHMTCLIAAIAGQDCINKISHSLVHIVLLQVRVILQGTETNEKH